MGQSLEQLRDKARIITDSLGHPIDEGILELVVVLWAHGFPTAASCQGHAETKHCRYPYVWIAWPDRAKRRSAMSEGAKGTIDPAMLEYRHRMIGLLNDYENIEREDRPDKDARLVMEDHGIFGDFTLQPQGAEILSMMPRELLPPAVMEEILERYHHEINAFCEFLKERLKVES